MGKRNNCCKSSIFMRFCHTKNNYHIVNKNEIWERLDHYLHLAKMINDHTIKLKYSSSGLFRYGLSWQPKRIRSCSYSTGINCRSSVLYKIARFDRLNWDYTLTRSTKKYATKQRRQVVLKTGRVVGPGLKTGVAGKVVDQISE